MLEDSVTEDLKETHRQEQRVYVPISPQSQSEKRYLRLFSKGMSLDIVHELPLQTCQLQLNHRLYDTAIGT